VQNVVADNVPNSIAESRQHSFRKSQGVFPEGPSWAAAAALISVLGQTNSQFVKGSVCSAKRKTDLAVNYLIGAPTFTKKTEATIKHNLNANLATVTLKPSVWDAANPKSTTRKDLSNTTPVVRTEGKSGAVRTQDGRMPSCFGHRNLANPRSAPRLDTCAINSGLRPETRETNGNEKPQG
jgi:hypothetical protein